MSFQRPKNVPTPYFQSHQFILKEKYILFFFPLIFESHLVFLQVTDFLSSFYGYSFFFHDNEIILLILLILTFRSSCSSFIFFVVFIEPLTCLWRAKLKIFVKVLTGGLSISKRSFCGNSTTIEYCHFYTGVCMYISFWDYCPSWELYIIHLLFFPQQSYFMKTYSACVTLADLQYLERERNRTCGIEMSSPGPCRGDVGPWSKVLEKGMQGQAPSLDLILSAWPQTFEILNFHFPLFILDYLDQLYSIHP